MSLKVVRLQAFTGEKEQDTTGDGLTPDHSLVRQLTLSRNLDLFFSFTHGGHQVNGPKVAKFLGR